MEQQLDKPYKNYCKQHTLKHNNSFFFTSVFPLKDVSQTGILFNHLCHCCIVRACTDENGATLVGISELLASRDEIAHLVS